MGLGDTCSECVLEWMSLRTPWDTPPPFFLHNSSSWTSDNGPKRGVLEISRMLELFLLPLLDTGQQRHTLLVIPLLTQMQALFFYPGKSPSYLLDLLDYLSFCCAPLTSACSLSSPCLNSLPCHTPLSSQSYVTLVTLSPVSSSGKWWIWEKRKSHTELGKLL